MPIKFLLLGGGGVVVFFEGGVEVPILFLWAWGFFRESNENPTQHHWSRVDIYLTTTCVRTSKTDIRFPYEDADANVDRAEGFQGLSARLFGCLAVSSRMVFSAGGGGRWQE